VIAVALWGLLGWAVLVGGVIALAKRWAAAEARLDADIAFMRAIPGSTNPRGGDYR
jgi:hypothetical protein